MRDRHEHTVSLSFLLGAFSFFSGFFFSFSAAAGFRRFMACRSRDTSGVLAHFSRHLFKPHRDDEPAPPHGPAQPSGSA